MQSFDIMQMRWIFLMLGGGLALTLLVLLGFYGRSAREPGREERDAALAEEGYRAPRAPPWFLVAIWAIMGAFAVGYVLWVAAGHVNM